MIAGAIYPLDFHHFGFVSPRSPRGKRFRRHRGCGEHATRTNSPRSAPPSTPWQVRAPCAPQLATKTAARRIVANSSTLRPPTRHDPRHPAHRGEFEHPAPPTRREDSGTADCGEFEHPAPLNSPQSAPPSTPRRIRAPRAPQLATIRAQGADRGGLRHPDFADVVSACLRSGLWTR
jgi:hypothetical protein